MSTLSDSEMKSKTDLTNSNAEGDIDDFLPKTSKAKYIRAYNIFMKWRADHNEKSFSEAVFIKYFSELAKKTMPSTLLNTYSMLKSTVYTKHSIDIHKYKKIYAFLKKRSKDVEGKISKTKVLTAEDVENFLNYAPDEIYLATKVVLILGISGACKCSELSNIMVDDVKRQDDCFLIDLRDSKNKLVRAFTVRDKFARFVERYQSFRPENFEHKRFFIQYQNGKCIKQAMGKQRMSEIPKQIAEYLRLPNSELYTGYCFRKSAEHIAEASTPDDTSIKRRGDGMKRPDSNKKTKSEEITKRNNIHIVLPRTVTATDLEAIQEVREPCEAALSITEEEYPYDCPIVDGIKKETFASMVDERIEDPLTLTSTLTNRYRYANASV